MRKNALTRALVRYLTTTTLHGFKYLRVPKYVDRTVWVAWCVTSAGCAGALCLVLWARFTQVPTVLSLKSTDSAAVLPSVALCAPAPVVAARVVGNLSVNYSGNSRSLTVALTRILRGQAAQEYQLSYLQHVLQQRGVTLTELLLRAAPHCARLAARCQVDGRQINCEDIIHRDITMYGACCILKPNARSKDHEVFYTKITTLEIVLNCPDEELLEFDFLVQHEGKGWLRSSVISAGATYFAPITYKYTVGDGHDDPIQSACVADESYSQTACQSDCIERACGCSDPMRSAAVIANDARDSALPVCSLVRLACLRSHPVDSKSCNCNPSCKQIRMNISLKRNAMYGLKYYVTDPLYKGLVPNKSAVLKMQIEKIGSYVFARMPTESWLTLLSSLGGVFNMFLGVGLFSALELIYFMFIRVPLALRRSFEIEISSAVGH